MRYSKLITRVLVGRAGVLNLRLKPRPREKIFACDGHMLLRNGTIATLGAKDLCGKKFGRLTAVEPFDMPAFAVRWLCRCACGNWKLVLSSSLVQGMTKSCGCLSRDYARQMNLEYSYRHGMAKRNQKDRVYNRWCGMKNRCYNHNDEFYPRYGGRGIRICRRYRNSFWEFFRDMGAVPFAKAQIDRRDNNGHYSCGKCPECRLRRWKANCRWVDTHEQARNRSTSRFVTINGITKNLTVWCPKGTKAFHRAEGRLMRGWDAVSAITLPRYSRRPTP